MKIIHLKRTGPWPEFLAKRDPDFGWVAECDELGIRARGATWAELLIGCAKGIDALLAVDGESRLGDFYCSVDSYSTVPGPGTRYDLPFEVRKV